MINVCVDYRVSYFEEIIMIDSFDDNNVRATLTEVSVDVEDVLILNKS